MNACILTEVLIIVDRMFVVHCSGPLDIKTRVAMARMNCEGGRKIANQKTKRKPLETVKGGPASSLSRQGVNTSTISASSPMPKVFLVNHGSFNLPHRGLIHTMIAAKQGLATEGYTAYHGVLAITHSDHIKGKGAKALMEDARLQCIDLICTNSDQSWIHADGQGIDVTSGDEMIA